MGTEQQIPEQPIAEPQKPREQLTQVDQSYWAIVKRQFRKNRLAVWSLRLMFVIISIGLLADFLANDRPLFCQYNGKSFFPVLSKYGTDLGLLKQDPDLINVDWKALDYDLVIWPPVPYSPTHQDLYNVHYVSPLKEQRGLKSKFWHHWMGTDEIGRDVLSGMIHGTRIAMLVGVVSMSIAAIIGILLGAMAGYFGDERLKVSRIRLWLNIIFFIFALFYAFVVRSFVLSDALEESMLKFVMQFNLSFALLIGIMLVPNLILTPILKRMPALGKKVTIPMDIIVSRLIEILSSIPRLLLILAIVAVAKPSIMLVMVVIGATSWTGIARFLRGELLKVRNLEYIEAAQSLGYSEARIIFRHAIPNSLTSVLIVIAFGIASAILIESSLSFLGIGVQAEVITWGKLLNLAREAPKAWWLAVIPGFAIFITVTIFNLLGEGLNDALDPRLKQ